jgi:hypothetical protein
MLKGSLDCPDTKGMPARELDLRTIAAATAGLCLAAGAAAFFTSTPTAEPHSLTLAPTPAFLILIEDDDEFFVASQDAINPMDFIRVPGIVVIEDDLDPGEAVARATVEDDPRSRSQGLFAALAASVAAVEVAPSAPSPPTPAPRFSSAPRPRMDLARPSMPSHPVSDERLASLESRSARRSSSHNRAPLLAARTVALAPRALTQDEIQSAIRQQLPKVRACYERQLKAEENLGGRMVLAMNISASGTVSRARLKGDDIGNEQLAACVLRELERFRFPAGSEALAVEYPVRFKPGL